MISIVKSGRIKIEGLTGKMEREIKKGLSLPNPSYHMALKRNPHAAYYLSPFIPYYEQLRQSAGLLVPRGVYDRIQKYVESHSSSFQVEDKTYNVPVSRSYTSNIVLRDYQEGVVEALASHREGIARLDTGFGKTFIAFKLFEKLKQKTLYVVPRLDLLEQTAREFSRAFGVEAGVIQGSTYDIQDFTIATIQSLRGRIKEKRLRPDAFGMVVADECHLYLPKKSRDVIQFFAPAYLFGLTATAERTDGQGEALEWIFGPIRVDRSLPREAPTFQLVRYEGKIKANFEYAQVIQNQIEDEKRNQLIAQTLESLVAQGRKVICLTKRVEHYKKLSALLTLENAAISSSMKKEERAGLYSGVRKDVNILLGTFPLLSTGLDIPQLDTLVIAGDLKSSVLTKQSIGRILRIFNGKQAPLIVDIQDYGHPILKHQARLREGFYLGNGWKEE